MTFIDTLNGMVNDLNSYKRDNSGLLEMYINDRLNKSLKTYYKELNQTIEYLNSKDALNVAKKMNRSM